MPPIIAGPVGPAHVELCCCLQSQLDITERNLYTWHAVVPTDLPRKELQLPRRKTHNKRVLHRIVTAASTVLFFTTAHLLTIAIMAAEPGSGPCAAEEPEAPAAPAGPSRKRAESEASWVLPPAFGGRSPEQPSGGSSGAGDQGSSSVHETRRVVTAMKSLDPKLLEQPGTFSGDVVAWRPWKLNLVSWLKSIDLRFERSLREAAAWEQPIRFVPAELKPLDSFLYALLLGKTTAVPFQIVCGAETDGGYEAWRRLTQEFEPQALGRRLSCVESLMSPDFGPESEFYERWLAWERAVEANRGLIGNMLDPEIMIPIVRCRCPVELQKHLRLNAARIGPSYAAMREELRAYFQRGRDCGL